MVNTPTPSDPCPFCDRSAVRVALAWSLAMPLLLGSAAVQAQSADLLSAFQSFETARAANQTEQALQNGANALALADSEHSPADQRIELLLTLGAFAAEADRDAPAVDYYQRALALQETQLGADHPDLCGTLSALATLHLKAQRYAQAEALLQRQLAIERAAYGARHENVLATLATLRMMYVATGDAAELATVDAALRPPTEVTHERAFPPRAAPAPASGSRYPQRNGFATVRVFYGTNRAASGDRRPALYYGTKRGELQYGYLEVTIPQTHKRAELETQPAWSDYLFKVDDTALRRRYVLLEKVAPLTRDAFAQALHQQIADTPSKDAFIFVHGFDNSFEDAARRVAQLAFDLDFDGTPILYSWPSQGSATAYAVDENAMGISGRRLADFLEIVVTRSGAHKIHLIAHSMGNRALIEALQTYLSKRAPTDRRQLFDQIVFTAPDIDRDYFMVAFESLRGVAARMTLYASASDYALRSSQIFHGGPRAGTAGDVIVRLTGLDTIDMSAVPADMFGHSYFAANGGAIYDLFRLLWRGDGPEKRCSTRDGSGGAIAVVWRFKVDLCQGGPLLEAGMLLKDLGDKARDHVLGQIAALSDPSQKQDWQLILERLNSLLDSDHRAGGGARP
jgi:esterase/lipase superfamily enzyme